MDFHFRPSRRFRFKRKVSHWKFVIKSYLKLEPCGYCGKVNDECVICHKCLHRWSSK